jgi:hypothetical protein
MSEYYAHCRRVYFNNFISDFAIWVFLSFASAAPLYFITAYAYESGMVDPLGKTDGLWSMGYTVSFSLICTHHGLVAIYTRNWTFFLLCIYIFSFLLYFPMCTLLLEYMTAGAYFNNASVMRVFLHDTMSQP